MTKITNSTVTKIAGRKRRSVLTTLGVFGFLLAGQNALAASWYAATIDGQGGPNGRVWDRMIPWSTIPTGGNGFFVYATALSTGTIHEGWYANGDWHFIPIYSSASAPALAVSASYVNNFYVAHVDSDWHLRLSSWSLFGGWTSQLVDGEGESTFNNLAAEVATVAYGGKLHIFYREYNQPWDGKNILHHAIYDGAHFTYQVIDGSANFAEPTAVQALDNGLRVYYYDQDNATLREAYSRDGVNWTSISTLDGTGGLGGDRGDVGHHPSAIVDPYNGTLNVFYEDRTNAKLRIAQLSDGWSFGSVDAMDADSYNAPVIHQGAMQVYYTSGGRLRGAWGTGPGTFNSLPIDGMGGIAVGSSPDIMYTPVTALEVNQTAPSVFYEDGVNGALRNSYWKP